MAVFGILKVGYLYKVDVQSLDMFVQLFDSKVQPVLASICFGDLGPRW